MIRYFMKQTNIKRMKSTIEYAVLNTNDLTERNLTVYPNPSTGNFTVETTANIKLQTLTIYSISGQLIDKTEDIYTTRYVYEKQLRQGTYLLVIQTYDNKVIYKKMVVL